METALDKADDTKADLVSIDRSYNKLRPMLDYNVYGTNVNMLLFVWDEARTLFHTGLDSSSLGDSTMSKFLR